MEEVIIFMIFIICFLGVWVTRLSRKITQLENDLRKYVVNVAYVKKDGKE